MTPALAFGRRIMKASTSFLAYGDRDFLVKTAASRAVRLWWHRNMASAA